MIRAALSLLLVTACVDETNLGNVPSTVPFTPSVRWATSFDPGGFASMWGLAMDSTGDVVAAGNIWGADPPVVNGDQVSTRYGSVTTFITKRNANDGSERWTVRVHKEPHRSLEIHGLAVDPDDNIVVTGDYGGTVDFGGKSLTSQSIGDTFVAKYSPSGSLIWVRGLSATAHTIGMTVEIDDSGAIYVSGTYTHFGGALTVAGEAHAPPVSLEGTMTYLVALDPEGSELWGRTFEADIGNIAIAMDGDVIITGSFYGPASVGGPILTPAEGADTFISRFGPDGEFVASRALGHALGYVQASVDAAGSVMLCVDAPGPVDTLVMLDDSFDVRWTSRAPESMVLARVWNETVGARIDMSAGTLDLLRIDDGGAEATASLGHLVTGSPRGSGFIRGATHASGAVAFGGEHNGSFDFGFGPVTGYEQMLIMVVDPMSEPVLTAN